MNEEVKKALERQKARSDHDAQGNDEYVFGLLLQENEHDFAVLEKALDKPATADGGMKYVDNIVALAEDSEFTNQTSINTVEVLPLHKVPMFLSSIALVRSSLQSAAEFRKRVEDEIIEWNKLAETKYTANGKERFACGQVTGVLTDLLEGGK